MIKVEARELTAGEFGYDELMPIFAVTVAFIDDETQETVFAGGNPLVAVDTEEAAIAYGCDVILPDLLANYPHRLAAFASQTDPVAEPTPEGV